VNLETSDIVACTHHAAPPRHIGDKTMLYTLWMHDRQIGETNFELNTAGRRRAGMFRPTAHGLTVLSGVTAMFPALIAFGELCRRKGIDVDDDRPEQASAALDAFGGTEEGQRVIAAAKQVAAVVVLDPNGRTLLCESLAISDLDVLAAMARKQKPGKHATVASMPGKSRNYVVSLTLALRDDRALAST
jgi:hypothetical protein